MAAERKATSKSPEEKGQLLKRLIKLRNTGTAVGPDLDEFHGSRKVASAVECRRSCPVASERLV
jgi:hypothetical protein